MAARDLTDDERAGAEDVRVAHFIPGDYQDGDAFGMSEDEKDWAAFRDEMGDAIDYAKITVYRVPTNPGTGLPTRRKMAFLMECGLNEYSFSQLCAKIQDQFGTGVYRIWARDKNGVSLKSKTVEIEAPKGTEIENSGGAMVNQIANAMREQSRQIEEMLSRNRAPGFDLEKMLNLAIPVATLLSTLGISFKREPPKSLVDQLSELKMLKDVLNDDSDGPPDTFWGALATTAQSFAKSFGPPLMAAISQAQRSGALNNQGELPQRRALASPAKNPGSANEEQPTMNVSEVKPQIEFLLTQARANVPPAQVVEFIMNALPDNGDAHESLESFLQQDDCFEQCAAVVPDLEPHRDWFGEWRAGMLAAIDDFFEDGETPEPPESDPNDPPELTGDESLSDDTPATAGGGATGNTNADRKPADSIDANGAPAGQRGDKGDT